MNKLVKIIALTNVLLIIHGCARQTEPESVLIDLGDVEDYTEFLEDFGDLVEPEPFQPEPLIVNAVGKVKAVPDIAVITALIVAKDKNESRAVDKMGDIINSVQDALEGREIETGFTAINSNREFDELCLDENHFAQRRHSEITSDYRFNKRLDDRGDTETKRREPKPRLKESVCLAQEIRVSTNMVIRIKPASAAGDVLRALSDAGAENANLYGYDFTDYDRLYQEAAARAVELARQKAQTVARVAGSSLGEIESFSVSAPERLGRYGPQPNVIRPANRYQGLLGSAIDRHFNTSPDYAQRENVSDYAGNAVPLSTVTVTGTRRRTSSSRARPAPPPPPAVQRVAPPTPRVRSTSQDEIQVVSTESNNQFDSTNDKTGVTNALSISLLSGPQTISVTAELGYTYETSLNGKIIRDPDEES